MGRISPFQQPQSSLPGKSSVAPAICYPRTSAGTWRASLLTRPRRSGQGPGCCCIAAPTHFRLPLDGQETRTHPGARRRNGRPPFRARSRRARVRRGPASAPWRASPAPARNTDRDRQRPHALMLDMATDDIARAGEQEPCDCTPGGGAADHAMPRCNRLPRMLTGRVSASRWRKLRRRNSGGINRKIGFASFRRTRTVIRAGRLLLAGPVRWGEEEGGTMP
jgi:hypothetical protein